MMPKGGVADIKSPVYRGMSDLVCTRTVFVLGHCIPLLFWSEQSACVALGLQAETKVATINGIFFSFSLSLSLSLSFFLSSGSLLILP